MSVTTIGFDKFRADLKALPVQVVRKADAFVQDAAKEWAALAKRSAPKDQGALVGRIQAVPIEKGKAEVVSPVEYRP